MSIYTLRLSSVVIFVVFNAGVSISALFSQFGPNPTNPACKEQEFLCLTGSCIQYSLLCDGVENCADGSDESEVVCGLRRVARQTHDHCRLPEQPLNGNYSLGGCNPPTCKPVAGSVVPYAILNYTCNPGYRLSGSRVLFCGERWSSTFPTCEQVGVGSCPPLVSSSQIITCQYASQEVRCDQPMENNTRADVHCREYYDAPQSHKIFSTVCQNGSWTGAIRPCTPKCGEFNFVPGNSSMNQSQHLPWYAAILQINENNKSNELLQYRCSAAIISSRAVVTAAHCVWDHIKRKPLPAEELAIKVGDPEHQNRYIQVDNILIHFQFRGIERNLADDISVVTLKNDIEFNRFIHPVCIDFENKYSPLFTPGISGIALSWGGRFDSTSKPNIVTLKLVDFADCADNVPESFLPYLTSDKFCAGEINKTTLCIGDSGGGLATKFRDGRWYITGISSIGVNGGDERCVLRYYSGFTRMSLYNDFITQSLRKQDSETSDGSSIPETPAMSCREDEFQCQSSDCIDNSLVCDGEKHCADGSDENSNVCGKKRCPTSAFQCTYGACINKNKVCDGVNNCVDGSDEESLLCKSNASTGGTCPAPASPGCKLPTQPENGNYQIRGCIDRSKTSVGTIVPQFVYLNYTCNPGYKLSGPSIIACFDGWSSSLPTCDRVHCPPLINPSREILCGSEIDQDTCKRVPLKVGTRVIVQCAPHFEQIPGLETYDMVCEENGKWSRQLQSCVPKCGVPNPGGLPFIGFGIKSQMGVFPWHIGFYKKVNDKIFPFCGGSLISARVIVSAAHCFWEADGSITKEFHVVAGKFYYDWNNKTKYVQHLQVREVVIHKLFNGPGRNYANDIALIILAHDARINEAVRPVCVDYESTFLPYFTPNSIIGNVTGWGLDENQNTNQVLHVANLPYVSVEECEKRTPITFSSTLTYDKFCAGNINRTTVCLGDSGGGYTVRFRNGRYYLQGIVSIGPDEQCALYPYATFTYVFHHLKFIRQYTLVYL